PDLNADVWAGGERLDRSSPAGEYFLVSPGIGSNADRTTDVVEHNLGVGEGARQIGELIDLRVIEPGVEREAEAAEHGEALPEGFVGEQLCRWAVGWVAQGGIRVPRGDVADAAEAIARGTQV